MWFFSCFILLFVFEVQVIYGYSNGAPKDACNSLKPSPYAHGDGQQVESGYKLTFENKMYKKGDKIALTLKYSAEVKQFKGVILQVSSSRGSKIVIQKKLFAFFNFKYFTILCSIHTFIIMKKISISGTG